jgi:hypothetical protein
MPSARNRGGNQSQMAPLRKRLKQADRQPVATRDNLFAAHGKEGIDDPSPSEGSLALLTNQSHLPRVHCRGLGYGLEYRTVSEPCISLQLVAAMNPHSFSKLQSAADRGSCSAWTFNPKVVGSIPTRPIVFLRVNAGGGALSTSPDLPPRAFW